MVNPISPLTTVLVKPFFSHQATTARTYGTAAPDDIAIVREELLEFDTA